MVICGIKLRVSDFDRLRDENVRDSKEIRKDRREELGDLVRGEALEVEFVEFGPAEIDQLRGEGTNLNRIEAIGYSKILNELGSEVAYLDSVGVNIEKFSSELGDLLRCEPDMTIEHKADKNHLPVSAASIAAKVRRDRRIDELKDDYGEIGSGYPCDSRTIEFLRNWVEKEGELPNIARKSWKTAQRIKSECLE